MLKKVLSLMLVLCLCIFNLPTYAWNALGHRLVAEIAYNHLKPKAKRILNRYNKSLNHVYRPQSLVYAAAWPDQLYYLDKLWLGQWHYIDLPYSLDGTPPQILEEENAVAAIEKAKEVLNNSTEGVFNKGFSLRLLLHIVGDIHQPLHAITVYRRNQPQGDKGGNLFSLGKNAVGKNLHQYWDRGGGFLLYPKRYSSADLKQLAHKIEDTWPCNLKQVELNPRQWANESHFIAIRKVYTLAENTTPSAEYEKMTQALIQQRIALAGCRLAATLNRLVD